MMSQPYTVTSQLSVSNNLCVVTSQHWIANNLFGLAFALNGVELLHLNNVSTGCILLWGLFVYDVFWVSDPSESQGPMKTKCCLSLTVTSLQVFGTNVMVTVAKSFEAPIKREYVRLRCFAPPPLTARWRTKWFKFFWFWHSVLMLSPPPPVPPPVVFPQDLLEKGLGASNFAMLGLGDIVIPGIFIALLLRFDVR